MPQRIIYKLIQGVHLIINPADRLPPELNLSGKQLRAVSLGCSGDSVWQIFRTETDSVPYAYLKQSTDPYRSTQLRSERDHLLWLNKTLAAQAEPKWQAPQVLYYLETEQAAYLLSSAIQGSCAHVSVTPDQRPAHLQQMVLALKALHQLPVADCPFDATLDLKLKQATSNWLAGRVDQSDFDNARLGTPITDLYQRLLAERPCESQPVFTHGDACLPNLILADPPGWIDWSRAGLAEPWQDLAIFCRSLRHNGYSQTEVEQALAIYGVAFDAVAYDYYTLLDEFF